MTWRCHTEVPLNLFDILPRGWAMLCLSASRMGEHGLRDLAKVHLREHAVDLSSFTVERNIELRPLDCTRLL